MPVVQINWFKGRSRDTKQKVAELIEKTMIDVAGCKPGDTHVMFNEYDRENWAINGKLRDQ